MAALAERDVQGVSTRKGKAITEELCGHSVSASRIGTINKGLDEALTAFAERRLEEIYPSLILDARYGVSGRPGSFAPRRSDRDRYP